MYDEMTFERQKIATRVITDKKYYVDDNIMEVTLEHNLAAYIYKHTVKKYNKTIYIDRPTFLEWLLRKQRSIVVNVDVSDILLDPPKLPDKTIRLYSFKEAING